MTTWRERRATPVVLALAELGAAVDSFQRLVLRRADSGASSLVAIRRALDGLQREVVGFAVEPLAPMSHAVLASLVNELMQRVYIEADVERADEASAAASIERCTRKLLLANAALIVP